jgi:hypothetical protein
MEQTGRRRGRIDSAILKEVAMIAIGTAFDRVAGMAKGLSARLGRRNRFVCADCSLWESCGRPPSDDCIEAAMQIELHEENIRWLRGTSRPR